MIDRAGFLISMFMAGGAVRAAELPRAAPEAAGLSSEKLDQVDSKIQELADKRQTAGAVLLVARKGKVVHLKAFGKMDLKAGKEMRADAIFRIRSMTKPVTTVAALLLWEEGRFRLDDPVAKYLPELKGLRVDAGQGLQPVKADREMTIRDLMRHTSGLIYADDTPLGKLYQEEKVGDEGDTLAELVRKLGRLPLRFQPGTRFNYGFSTDVLARLVEVLSGRPFDGFLEERIFRPLDMKDTGFFVPNDQLSRFSTGYRTGQGGGLEVSDSPETSRFREKPKRLSGGGGLVSTARDYLRFCQMLLNGGELQGVRLLRPDTVRQMTSNQLPAEAMPMVLGGYALPGLGYGFGVSVKREAAAPKPDPAAGEYGWSGADSTFFWVAPKEDLVVIVLQQLEPINLTLLLALKPAIYAALKD